MRGLGLLTLRLVVGLGLMAHGLPKLVPVWGGSPRQNAAILEGAGIGGAYLVTVGTGLVESLGGLLLMVGAYTVWVSGLLALTTVAMGALLHLPHGFFLNWILDPERQHGYEFHFLRAGALVCLMVAGPGAVSHDGLRAKRSKRKR